MRASCEGCPKRDSCNSICPDIERLLPAADAKTRAKLGPVDKGIAWSVQDHEDILTQRQRLVARLYHRFGFKMTDIACVLRVHPSAVCQILQRIRKKIAEHVKKTS